jgi:hypothetical protein
VDNQAAPRGRSPHFLTFRGCVTLARSASRALRRPVEQDQPPAVARYRARPSAAFAAELRREHHALTFGQRAERLRLRQRHGIKDRRRPPGFLSGLSDEERANRHRVRLARAAQNDLGRGDLPGTQAFS